jgi:hypothetical protein
MTVAALLAFLNADAEFHLFTTSIFDVPQICVLIGTSMQG